MPDRTVTTTIDETLCNGCGRCIKVCPSETISMSGKKAVITGTESLNCGHCQAVCPTGAIGVSSLNSDLSTFKTFKAKGKWLPHGGANIQELVNLMQSRRSCRNYHAKPVPRDILEDLVKIGVSAPSGTNSQDWTFTILPNRPAVLQLARWVGGFFRKLNRTAENVYLRKGLKILGRHELENYFQNYYESVREGLDMWEREGKDILFHGAPAAILVGSKKTASCPSEDALLATQNILLAAHAMGLGTCLIGFAVEAVKRDRRIPKGLGVPDDEEIYSVIALGYPKEKYQRIAGRKQALVRYHESQRPV